MPPLPERADNRIHIAWTVEHKSGSDMPRPDLYTSIERRLANRIPKIDWFHGAGSEGAVYRGRVFGLQTFKDAAFHFGGGYPLSFFER